MMEVPGKKVGMLSGEWQIASNIFKGSLGNMIEWFDWYVYASFSIYFSAAFFPASNQTAELLSTAAVFAIGFLMRPLGSLIMGQFADKKGRKAALTLSVTIMAGGASTHLSKKEIRKKAYPGRISFFFGIFCF